MKTAIGYYRASTTKQGASGLDLAEQREAVTRCLNYGGWELAAEFEELESGRKGANSRPQLLAAIAACEKQKATLIIAKIDRVARDARFFLEVLDDSRIDIRFAEFADIDPKTDDGRMLLIAMANFAEFEGCRISARTKAGLAVAKASGKVLGHALHKDGGAKTRAAGREAQAVKATIYANSLRHVIEPMRKQGMTFQSIADRLNAHATPTARGGKWGTSNVRNIILRWTESGLCEVLHPLEVFQTAHCSHVSDDVTAGKNAPAQTLAEVLAWLATQERVSLAELRSHLLPLDLLPSAVIDELNECALDLTGDIALEDSGEEIVVVSEALAAVIAKQE